MGHDCGSTSFLWQLWPSTSWKRVRVWTGTNNMNYTEHARTSFWYWAPEVICVCVRASDANFAEYNQRDLGESNKTLPTPWLLITNMLYRSAAKVSEASNCNRFIVLKLKMCEKPFYNWHSRWRSIFDALLKPLENCNDSNLLDFLNP